MTKTASRSQGRPPERAPARAPKRPRPGRPSGERTPSTRDALLDAAEAIMLEEGYAAVSTRRVAAKAGTDKALVHYYFGTMDDLFIALFGRSAERGADHMTTALASPQPLWALWDALHDQSNAVLMTEFIALANHRKAVKSVMVESSRSFRQMQLDRLADVLAGYGVDANEWPAAAVVMTLSAISRHLRTDESFGVDLGHSDTVALVERHIRALEGARVTGATGTPATRRGSARRTPAAAGADRQGSGARTRTP